MKKGIFEIDMALYERAPGIRQSNLKLLARSPAHLRYALEHPTPSTPDQILGTVLDMALFDPANVWNRCYTRPKEYVDFKGCKKPWHNGSTFAKDWYRQHGDKPVITPSQFNDIILMRDAIMKHPAAALALSAGKINRAMFWMDESTGLQCKAYPDLMSGNTIVDLKKCRDAGEHNFSKTIANFGYDVQAAWYLDGGVATGQIEENAGHFVFIVAEDAPPYAVAVWELQPESVSFGRLKYRRLLNRYLDCVGEGKWPAYSANIEYIGLPGWAKKAEFEALALEDSPREAALLLE
jgi:hypothetical protein